MDAEVAKLSTLFSVWRNQRYANESEVGRLPVLIQAQEARIGKLAQDLAQREPQALEGFAVEVNGRCVRGADLAGDVLRGIVKATWEEVRTSRSAVERMLGRFGGLDLGIRGSRQDEAPQLYLSGQYRYEVAPYQTGPSLVAGLLAALALVEKEHADAVDLLTTRRKRLDDLKLELSRPFEHDVRLQELLVRQRELLAALDLTKDEAGSAGMDAHDSQKAA